MSTLKTLCFGFLLLNSSLGVAVEARRSEFPVLHDNMNEWWGMEKSGSVTRIDPNSKSEAVGSRAGVTQSESDVNAVENKGANIFGRTPQSVPTSPQNSEIKRCEKNKKKDPARSGESS